MGKPGRHYIAPKSAVDGSTPAEKSAGVYTLASGTTYYYALGGSDAPFQAIHLVGKTSAAVVTSATIQDTVVGPNEASDTNDNSLGGFWVPEVPSTAYVGVVGTGWSMSSPGVAAAAGTGVGGALWHLKETGADRSRLAVVVGGVGGDFMVSGAGKA